MQISEEDFKNWWFSPVGVEVQKMLRERISLIEGQCCAEGAIRDQITGAVLVGRKLEINDLLEMTYQELMG